MDGIANENYSTDASTKSLEYSLQWLLFGPTSINCYYGVIVLLLLLCDGVKKFIAMI